MVRQRIGSLKPKILTLTIRGISANRILNITLATLEDTILGLVGHVIVATNKIITVLAVVRGGNAIVTGFEAEDT
jgi:hypothetical protein